MFQSTSGLVLALPSIRFQSRPKSSSARPAETQIDAKQLANVYRNVFGNVHDKEMKKILKGNTV